jgi:hypothetical protein
MASRTTRAAGGGATSAFHAFEVDDFLILDDAGVLLSSRAVAGSDRLLAW